MSKTNLDNEVEGNEGKKQESSVNIEDIITQSIKESPEFLKEILAEIERVQKINISFFKFPFEFWFIRKKLFPAKEVHTRLYNKFREKYILHPDNMEIPIQPYHYSSLPGAVRELTKDAINLPLVNLSLMCYSSSYENMVRRMENLLNTLDNTISNKLVIYQNAVSNWLVIAYIFLTFIMLVINFIMVVLFFIQRCGPS